MLKKLLITLVLGLSIAFPIAYRPPEVSAYTYQVVEDWESYNFYSTYWGMRITGSMVPFAERMIFTIPDTDYNLPDLGGIDSALVCTFEGSVYDETIPLTDLVSYRYGNTYYVPLATIGCYGAYSFALFVMQDWTAAPAQYVDFWNLNANVFFDYPNATVVKYYDQFVLYDAGLFYTYPEPPTDPTPPVGYIFTGWRLPDGTVYTFNYIRPDMLTITYQGDAPSLNLYATYRPATSEELTPTDPVPDSQFQSLLTAFGLWNDAGTTFLYVLILMIAVFLLVWWKAPLWLYLVAGLGVTTLFTIFGYLPIIVLIVMFMMFATIFMLSMKRGGSYE